MSNRLGKSLKINPTSTSHRQGTINVPHSDIVTVTITTENAPTQDMETLMFDSTSGDLYIVSKNHEEASCNIYRFTPPSASNSDAILAANVGERYIARKLPKEKSRWCTALLRRYGDRT